MTYLDAINCIFEFIGGVVIWLSVWQICKDGGSRGVHWGQAIFFTLEGFWNLKYYVTLNQMFSFYAGVFVCLGNLAWVWLAFVWFRKLRASSFEVPDLKYYPLCFSKLLRKLRIL